ncbi:hypothetical protein [Kitasatospora purpeofusca]|uniref:hypothetical protein n=1 Tax=Kitasatospora purpeofusca TaxID=67352 RepID=UPI0035E30170
MDQPVDDLVASGVHGGGQQGHGVLTREFACGYLFQEFERRSVVATLDSGQQQGKVVDRVIVPMREGTGPTDFG